MLPMYGITAAVKYCQVDKTAGLCPAFNSGQEHSRGGLVLMIFLNIECRTRNNEYRRKKDFVAGLTEKQ
jgi:hypothetical protein